MAVRWPRVVGLFTVAMLSAVVVFGVRVHSATEQAAARATFVDAPVTSDDVLADTPTTSDDAGADEPAVPDGVVADEPAPAAEFGHVSGIALDHSGALYVATRTGLYRIVDEQTAERVSKEALDLTSFTVDEQGRFLASGHPAPGAAGPALLGLIQSTDHGVTWRTVSLPGTADFGVLGSARGAVYGYDTSGGVFMVSTDLKSWQRRSTVALAAFAVDTANPQRVIAAGTDGLQSSEDGGRTWSTVAGAPALSVLAWGQKAEVWGAGSDGVLWHSADGGATWLPRGVLPGDPQAIAIHGSSLFAAVGGDEIDASDDGGVNWVRIYAPARPGSGAEDAHHHG